MDKINTKTIKVDSKAFEKQDIRQGAELIKAGKMVAFPTETVYGLGANGLDPKAVANLFLAKGRPQDNPLILHVHSIDQVRGLVEDISEEGEKLMKMFWPGPLTLLFQKSKLIPEIITAGLDTVAIRMPNHPVALELIRASGLPIAGPSANSSGKPSPTMASHVETDLAGKIHMIIDGGSTGLGLESTVLDLTGPRPIILRPGGITLEDLQKIIPNVEEDLSIIKDDKDIVPKSPGQKYRHYAPRAEMILFSGDLDPMIKAISHQAKNLIGQGKKVGIMATDETVASYRQGLIISLGSRKDKKTIAHNLFHTLRLLDGEKVDIILCEGMEMAGIGTAIMNRLKKASSGNIKTV